MGCLQQKAVYEHTLAIIIKTGGTCTSRMTLQVTSRQSSGHKVLQASHWIAHLQHSSQIQPLILIAHAQSTAGQNTDLRADSRCYFTAELADRQQQVDTSHISAAARVASKLTTLHVHQSQLSFTRVATAYS
jgi:hypothetical protein